MNFADGAVIVVFSIIGYLLVGSVLNWYEERKKTPPRNSKAERTNEFGKGSNGNKQSSDSEDTNGLRQWQTVLEVSSDATLAQIRAAYQQKISQYHPDKVATMAGEIRALAEMRSKEINAAYNQAVQSRSS